MIQNGERPVHHGESLRLELHPESSVEQTLFFDQWGEPMAHSMRTKTPGHALGKRQVLPAKVSLQRMKHFPSRKAGLIAAIRKASD